MCDRRRKSRSLKSKEAVGVVPIGISIGIRFMRLQVTMFAEVERVADSVMVGGIASREKFTTTRRVT
jgi:hypothetical protein